MKHLYPTGQAFLHEWPTTELDVEDDVAEELLAYHPAVYSLEPTGWPPAADPPSDVPHETTEAPENPGPSDSTAEE